MLFLYAPFALSAGPASFARFGPGAVRQCEKNRERSRNATLSGASSKLAPAQDVMSKGLAAPSERLKMRLAVSFGRFLVIVNGYVMETSVPIISGHGQICLRPKAYWRGDFFYKVVRLPLLAPTVQRILTLLVGIREIDLRAGLQIVPTELDEVWLAVECVLPEVAAQRIW